MAPTGDYSHGNPLAHLSESVNAIDPLNAMEKTINEVHKYIGIHFVRDIDCNYWHVQSCEIYMNPEFRVIATTTATLI